MSYINFKGNKIKIWDNILDLSEKGINAISKIKRLEALKKLIDIDIRGNPIYESYLTIEKNTQLRKLIKLLDAQELFSYWKQSIENNNNLKRSYL